MIRDLTAVDGLLHVRLFNEDDTLASELWVPNMVTDIGDKYYAEAGAALCANGTVAAPAGITGMRLGTGVTAASKTGAGAAIGTYISGSNVAITGGYPTSSQPGGAGTARRIIWRGTWNPGVATANSISEVVVTNETPLSNVAGVAANTIARAVLSPVQNKGATQTMVVDWYHDILGS